jgi:hypothetical protein
MNDQANSSPKSPLLPCQEPAAVGASCQNDQGNATRKADSALELLTIAACIILFVFQALWTMGNNLLNALPKLPADEATIMERSITEASASASQTEQQRRSLAYDLLLRRDSVKNLTSWVTLTDPGRWITAEHTEPPEGDLENMFDQRTEAEADITKSHSALSLISLIKRKMFGLRTEASALIEAKNWEDSVITEAKNRMDLLQQFILPLLYGWIGALAYILKSEQENTDRKENTLWGLRMLLGMMAGLAIGWFFKPPHTEVNGFGLVSPFALAFLAGYSVDLLSKAMDRVVRSLEARVGKEESSNKMSGPSDSGEFVPATGGKTQA